MLAKLGCGYFATSRSMIRNNKKSSKLPFKYMHRWSTMLVRVYNHNRCQKGVKYMRSYLDALLWVEPSSSCFLDLFFIIVVTWKLLLWWCYVQVFTVKSWKKVELSHMLHQAAFAKRTAKASPLRQRIGWIKPYIKKKKKYSNQQ